MEIYDNDEGDDDSDGGIEVDDENDEETMLPGKEESSSGTKNMRKYGYLNIENKLRYLAWPCTQMLYLILVTSN